MAAGSSKCSAGRGFEVDRVDHDALLLAHDQDLGRFWQLNVSEVFVLTEKTGHFHHPHR